MTSVNININTNTDIALFNGLGRIRDFFLAMELFSCMVILWHSTHSIVVLSS